MSEAFFKAGTFRLGCGALVYVVTKGDTTSLVGFLPEQPELDRHWPPALREARDTGKNIVVKNDCPKELVDLTTLSTENREWLAGQPEPPDAEEAKPRGRPKRTEDAPKVKRERVAETAIYHTAPGAADPFKKAGIPRAVFQILNLNPGITALDVAARLKDHEMFAGSTQEPLVAAKWWLKVLVEKGAATRS